MAAEEGVGEAGELETVMGVIRLMDVDIVTMLETVMGHCDIVARLETVMDVIKLLDIEIELDAN